MHCLVFNDKRTDADTNLSNSFTSMTALAYIPPFFFYYYLFTYLDVFTLIADEATQ